ncbi:MAG: c-type heme family protein [Planctomycetota bacterium]
MKSSLAKKIALAVVLVALILSVGFLIAIITAGPAETVARSDPLPPQPPSGQPRTGDQELAYLLVKLELETRSVIAGHYARSQSSFPGIDALYKRWLTRNMILPAAAADNIFAEVVPQATSGRAWVKMVVDKPRNPNNLPDGPATELLAEIKSGATTAERATEQAYYYAEPIKTNALCLRCHGEPAGEPDPSFPTFQKNGWKAGQVVGAVVARVAKAGTMPSGGAGTH